jgi:hypothetical protein
MRSSTPARRAIALVRAPANPLAENSTSAALSTFSRVRSNPDPLPLLRPPTFQYSLDNIQYLLKCVKDARGVDC